MITKEILPDLLKRMAKKDKDRILKSQKEFCVLELHVFNVGSYVTVKLTNDYDRYKYAYVKGDGIVYTSDIQKMLNENK